MRFFASFVTTAALAATLLEAAPAAAEVRDHRSPNPGYQQVDNGPRRYRRRPGPRFMMPLKIDIGATGADTRFGYAGGIGGAIGIHWASLSPTPTDTDVGIGVFGAILAAPTDPMSTTAEEGVAYGGAYLELGKTLSRGDFWRTWASARGEYLGSTAFGEDQAGLGAAGRLSAELYVSGVGIEPRGLFLGTYAIGVYAEVGVRDVASAMGNFHVTGGLTFRTPLVFAP